MLNRFPQQRSYNNLCRLLLPLLSHCLPESFLCKNVQDGEIGSRNHLIFHKLSTFKPNKTNPLQDDDHTNFHLQFILACLLVFILNKNYICLSDAWKPHKWMNEATYLATNRVEVKPTDNILYYSYYSHYFDGDGYYILHHHDEDEAWTAL